MTLHSYTAPGDGHVALDGDDLYRETVRGTALVDWLTALLARRVPVDVS